MKKIYIAPSEYVVKISTCSMLAESGGVTTNSTLGNEFNAADESCTREMTTKDLWDNEW